MQTLLDKRILERIPRRRSSGAAVPQQHANTTQYPAAFASWLLNFDKPRFQNRRYVIHPHWHTCFVQRCDDGIGSGASMRYNMQGLGDWSEGSAAITGV